MLHHAVRDCCYVISRWGQGSLNCGSTVDIITAVKRNFISFFMLSIKAKRQKACIVQTVPLIDLRIVTFKGIILLRLRDRCCELATEDYFPSCFRPEYDRPQADTITCICLSLHSAQLSLRMSAENRKLLQGFAMCCIPGLPYEIWNRSSYRWIWNCLLLFVSSLSSYSLFSPPLLLLLYLCSFLVSIMSQPILRSLHVFLDFPLLSDKGCTLHYHTLSRVHNEVYSV
jgi:hypothetical protein